VSATTEGPDGLQLRWRQFRQPDPGAADAADRAFGMWLLDDPDVLLDRITQEEYERNDERMPYFGALWPSAESLVDHVLAGPRLDGVELLDLGCGLGACGLAALARGARVTFMDWEPRALAIVAQSVRTQGRAADAVRLVTADWRRPPPLGPFDRVLGADVLYEERNAPAVADFLATHLEPGGEAWITDPGRPHARRFPALATARGLRVLGSTPLAALPHGIAVALHRFGH